MNSKIPANTTYITDFVAAIGVGAVITGIEPIITVTVGILTSVWLAIRIWESNTVRRLRGLDPDDD